MINNVNSLQPYTLVVVDMQSAFKASQGESVLLGVAAEIKLAIASGQPVVILESNPRLNGPTHRCLTDLLQGYDTLRHIVLTKDGRGLGMGSGGGREVAEACDFLGFPTERFRLCGVNTDICVFFTTLELSRHFGGPQLELVRNACSSQWCDSEEQEWASFAYYARFHEMSSYTVC